MTRKLLMIEDDVSILDMVENYTKLRGWSFFSARTGADGLEAARQLKPDVVILDIQLPDQTGWEVCKSIRSEPDLGQVPVIMVSGSRRTPEDKAAGLEIGADDYLGKPFDLEELELRMDLALRARQA